MFTWRTAKWRYKALAISLAANSIVAASVFVLGYFTAWLLIPGAFAAFWICNELDAGCLRDRYENAAWALGWLLNTILCWGAIWAIGAAGRAGRRA